MHPRQHTWTLGALGVVSVAREVREDPVNTMAGRGSKNGGEATGRRRGRSSVDRGHSGEQSRARKCKAGEIRTGLGWLPQVETKGLTNEVWGAARMRVDGGGSSAPQETLR
jgi:hypothetical protein